MTPHFPPLDLVIFDLDGVLADSGPSHAQAWDDLWRHLGIEGPAYATIAGLRSRDVVEQFTTGLTATAADRESWARFKQTRARGYLSAKSVLFPEVPATIRALAAGARRLAIGTGSSQPTAHAILERSGLRSLFVAVVTGDEVALGKPDPEIFLRAMAAAKGEASRTLVVEDAAAGLAAADRAGMWSVTVRSDLEGTGGRWLGAFPDLVPVAEEVLACR